MALLALRLFQIYMASNLVARKVLPAMSETRTAVTSIDLWAYRVTARLTFWLVAKIDFKESTTYRFLVAVFPFVA